MVKRKADFDEPSFRKKLQKMNKSALIDLLVAKEKQSAWASILKPKAKKSLDVKKKLESWKKQLLRTIKKTGHKQSNKAWSEFTEGGLSYEDVKELLGDIEIQSDTKSMLKVTLNPDELTKWLGIPHFIKDVKFTGKSWGGMCSRVTGEVLNTELKYNKKQQMVTIRTRTCDSTGQHGSGYWKKAGFPGLYL